MFTLTTFEKSSMQTQLKLRAEEMSRRMEFQRCFDKYYSNTNRTDGTIAQRRDASMRAAARELGYEV